MCLFTNFYIFISIELDNRKESQLLEKEHQQILGIVFSNNC